MTDRDQLHHLADRARRGVLLPAEGALPADAVAELEKRAEFYEAAHSRMRDRAEVAAVRATRRITELEQRAERAEAAIERVRTLHRETCLVASGPLSTTFSCGICDALDQPQQPTTTKTASLATPCNICTHPLNWHRNEDRCSVHACYCRNWQQPTV